MIIFQCVFFVKFSHTAPVVGSDQKSITPAGPALDRCRRQPGRRSGEGRTNASSFEGLGGNVCSPGGGGYPLEYRKHKKVLTNQTVFVIIKKKRGGKGK